MRTPAAAIAWEFGSRHRWGFAAAVSYFAILGAIRLALLAAGRPIDIADAMAFAFMVLVPSTAAFFYFLAIFSFGLSGDLAARQSIYPARMFALPVTTAELAGWPMLYGTVTVAVVWFVVRLGAPWPREVEMPLVWPALLAASLLAWTQALTWRPYPLRGLRVVITVSWLMAIDVIVIVAYEAKASEGAMLLLLAPQIPLAFLAARSGVAQARRGGTADWVRWLAPLRLRRTTPVKRFRSAHAAQDWFEWRRHGRTLPALVAILLPFELLFLSLFRETPEIVLTTLAVVLITPPFLALFVAATAPREEGSDPYLMPPFLATRPIATSALATTRIKVAARSTFVAWALVAVSLPAVLQWSGTSAIVIERLQALDATIGTPRAAAIVALLFAALVAATWTQLVQSLCIAMSGRGWLVKASVFVPLSLLSLLGPLMEWIGGMRPFVAMVWKWLPLIVTTLVCIKLAAAGWIAVRLHARGLMRGRTLVAAAASWDLSVFALFGCLAWIVPAILVPRHLLLLIAILALPLVRPGALPLALDWNRHR